MTEPVVLMATETYLSRDTADDFGSPTWDTIDNAFNVNSTSDVEGQQVERGQIGRKQYAPGNTEEKITFSMKHIASDADFTALETAHTSKAVINLAIWDGNPATSGVKGRKFRCHVTKIDANREHGQPVSYSIECVEAVGTAPADLTVS
jgi:hypothetical protein